MTLIKSVSYYQDDKNVSAQKAFCDLSKSSLFGGKSLATYEGRMQNAAQNLLKNDQWKVNMDADGDGTKEDVNLADAIADSFDSELDLYIQSEFEKVIAKYGHCSKQYLSEDALAELKSKGIEVSCVGGKSNRVYSFSLVDEKGKVLEDENGKKGSIIFADCLIPDGYAQGAEVNLSAILDCMGKDCISKADFVGRESEYYDVISQVETNIKGKSYDAKSEVGDIYGNVKDITEAVTDLWGGHGGGSYGQGGIHGDSVVYGDGIDLATEEELKAQGIDTENAEYIPEFADIEKSFNKMIEDALKAKKDADGIIASDAAYQNIISAARTVMGSMYTEELASKLAVTVTIGK